jgi:phosphoribosylanthranilate isomerase
MSAGRLIVKICGLCSAADVAAVGQMGPDAVGFVFWNRSPRCVSPEEVGDWAARLPPSILRVGVFVDADEDIIRSAVRVAGLDVVQLHGFQTLEKSKRRFPDLGKTRDGLPTRIWGAVHIGRNEDIALQRANLYDAFVVDSFTPATPGGTGRRCDWDAARRFIAKSAKPVLLAGGLTPDNVREAVERTRPAGVDVSSGVERTAREKDLRKVERFINECRR